MANEDNGLGGDLDIKSGANVTIRTNGNSPATISATNLLGGGDRVFNVLSGGTLTLEKVVVTGGISNNSIGGGIYNSSSIGVALRNTIVAGNFDTPNNAGSGTKNPDIRGTVQGNGYNLIGNLTGASGTVGTGSDIVLASGQTAGLGALANNGGVTQTHALLSGSRAINAGLTPLISQDLGDIDGDGNTTEIVPFDQRGGNFTRVNGSSVDIGAFEFQTVTTLSTLRINDLTITEGNSGTKNAVFTVTRTGTPTGTITLNYATANGTATAGSDTNETSKTISVVINGDTTIEPNETFFVNLSNPTNATIADNQGRGTITNDDTSTNLLLVGNANNNNLVGGTGNDTLRGLGGNDTLTGGAGNDRIEGGTGADRMVGGNGNDTLIGGVGNDTLTGSAGNDFFRFNSPTEGVDRITDFNVTEDTILISRSGFGGGLPFGVLSPNRFRVGSSANTTDHRFFYNASNGSLFFDVDGNGATSAIPIATLNTGLAMTNADIVVI